MVCHAGVGQGIIILVIDRGSEYVIILITRQANWNLYIVVCYSIPNFSFVWDALYYSAG